MSEQVEVKQEKESIKIDITLLYKEIAIIDKLLFGNVATDVKTIRSLIALRDDLEVFVLKVQPELFGLDKIPEEYEALNPELNMLSVFQNGVSFIDAMVTHGLVKSFEEFREVESLHKQFSAVLALLEEATGVEEQEIEDEKDNKEV